ncbi:hypothetical protein DXG01_013846 [Tephrocybe rancida]|nr:hypothetical protein DXG01_013846 [Tephrocybe rancida]
MPPDRTKNKRLNLWAENEETKLLRKLAPFYLRASKERKLDTFFSSLRSIWQDRFPQETSILRDKPVRFADENNWIKAVRNVMVWIGPVHGYDCVKEVCNHWEQHMTVDSDRLSRVTMPILDYHPEKHSITLQRIEYYSLARLGTYLRGPQYLEDIVTQEERNLIERNGKDNFQFMVRELEEKLWPGGEHLPEIKLYHHLVNTLEFEIWGAGRLAFEASGKELSLYILERMLAV